MITPEQYKEEQKRRILGIKAGCIDMNGNQITKVFARSSEFVIYEIESKDLAETLKVHVDNVTEKDESGIIERYHSIRIKFVEIKGLLYKVVDKTTIKTIIAQILAHGLTDDPAESNRQFDALKSEINKDYKEQFANRLRLLFSSLVVTLFIISFAVATYFNGWFNSQIHIKNLIFITASGSIGGFFSLSASLKKVICEKDVSKFLYIIYGVERIFISILASTIIYFAIRAQVIFGTTNSMDNPLVGYILFGFLAGFSETLVPNLMTKLEK